MKGSRRDFVKAGAVSAMCGAAMMQSRELFAKTLKLPLGLQLYSVRELLPKEFDGTLKDLGALGYREVESAGYFGHSAAEVKRGLDAAGLKLVSAHFPSDDLHKRLDEILAFHHELGVGHIICSSPGRDPSRAKSSSPGKGNEYTLNDWRWNADEFNKFGEKVSAAGMKFGYHNHTAEFHQVDGVTPFDELIRLTDPAKVTIEMDCGWVIVGGGDPVACLKKHPKRISMLHVKDFKRVDASGSKLAEPKIEELGLGSVDYRPIFEEAGKTGNIEHCFVEQEGFNVPPMQSLKIDADYMRKLGAA